MSDYNTYCDRGASFTSDVGEAEALRLSAAVGLRVKIEPHPPPGGKKGRWHLGATQPGLAVPRGAQHKPVAGATSRLRHVEVPETAARMWKHHRESFQSVV